MSVFLLSVIWGDAHGLKIASLRKRIRIGETCLFTGAICPLKIDESHVILRASDEFDPSTRPGSSAV
jgi:hypothetical protein